MRQRARAGSDRREAACRSGTDRAHFYSASTPPRLTAPTGLPRIGARQIGILAYITPVLSTALLMLTSGRTLDGSIALAAALIVGAAILGIRAR